MKVLALETSTPACSAALWVDGDIRERFETGSQHSHRILSMVGELLDSAGLHLAGLDAIAFGRGPGSFTGLRIAAAVTQGLAFAADLPVLPVSSLAALAQGEGKGRVLAALDARMNQVYWGAYQCEAGSRPRLVGAEIVAAPADLPAPPGADWWGAGSGWDLHAGRLAACWPGQLAGWTPGRLPHAREVAALGAAGFACGEGLPAEQALPVYVRDDVAKRSAGNP
ncbi:MAG: tRNA (adenosine(37)-N6)-threonylcarbamoyltransferase complex dimerization subunit type 1 TsaB [Pseudomonadota bacterium]|nr:tRNA (adenosine(37)-N6)-threonylcarbamoyltransferase complex dimerization subunit type 1 TsaB [Pseudomonadota bacterium]